MPTETPNSNTIRLDDGYLNAFMPSLRGRMTNYSAEMMAGTALHSQPALESQYIQNGFARLIVDKPAEEMTRAGFDIVGLDESLTQDIKSRLEELEAVKRFNEAIKWRRAFGGGLIVLGIKDGNGSLNIPVNEESISAIEFMRVYDRFEASCSKRYDDPMNVKHGEVELWRISPKTGGTPYDVHESRVLIFDGESVTNNIRVSNEGWGASVIQSCFIQLVRLDSAYRWSLLLLERMQQAIHGIPDLSSQISDAAGEALVAKRIGIVDTVRSALNTVVIDSEETYEIKQLTISGVNEILDRYIRALSAVSGIPAYLIGENISGMNSGSSNKEGWITQVESWQNDQYRKPLDRLISLLILAMSDGASDGDDYTIKFKPLFAPSDAEQATVNKQKADTFSVYVNMGAMDADEVRDSIRDEYNLIGDAPEPEPEEPEPLMLNPGQQLVSHPNATKPLGKTAVLAKGAPIPKPAAKKLTRK